MSWKKYFRSLPAAQSHPTLALPTREGDAAAAGTSSKFSSYLPEVYAGHPNRIQRYYQYDDMDKDSDINAALDTIADFCTQSEEQNDEPFEIAYLGDATDTEVKLIKTSLARWIRINNFRQRLWHTFRNCMKYGDQFFVCDPETMEWLWVDPFMVELVKVNESAGKEADEYVMRGLDLGKQAKFATTAADPSQYRTPLGTSNVTGARPTQVPAAAPNVFSLAGSHSDPRQRNVMAANELFVVDAEHVVHLSLSVGMDINWPFGKSVLEPIFKTFKQKELLEDAIIIYRVQRAPERRIFYIDTGSMPPPRAKAHIEQIKNEIHQRRIPNRTGGGASVLDAAYNPLSVMEDYFFAQSADGRGSKVETLPGGEQVGEITDLSFFSRKMARGLRIPASYLAIGDEQSGGGMQFNDGRLGAAMIQEFLFTKHCMRLQSLLAPPFDKSFKRYLRKNGISIDENIFELRFNPPQNFAKYRQIELDTQQVQVFSQISENRRLSERFKLKRFLNLSEDEILENERMWAEENPERVRKSTGASPAEDIQTQQGLPAVGLRGGGDFGDFGAPPDDGFGGEPPPDAGAPPADAGAAGAPPPPPPPPPPSAGAGAG